MLYLNSSYYLIDGVSLFPDHESRRKFYFLPMMPHLTMVRDASGNVLPQIQLIEYEGAAGAGGFINFDVNLGLDPEKVTEVAAKLKRQVGLSDELDLQPVPFVDGTVK